MFALYIHWPFCVSRCPYCDFNAHVRERIPAEKYEAALLSEMAHYAALTKGRKIHSIFFGGGTPSLMPPEMAGRLLDCAEKLWGFEDNIEITLEANPTTIETGRFEAFHAAGINRVSIGVQSLNDADLKYLGRAHGRDQALFAIKEAAKIFDRYSFDLIYARPGQTVESWRAELSEALPLMRDHLSLYQLTIEPNTQFQTLWKRGDLVLPDDDTSARLYDMTAEMLAPYGLSDYEISNYAKPGYESRHNLVYWKYGEYAGIGCGAHGRINIGGVKHATKQFRAPETWMEKVENGGHGTEETAPLSAPDRAAEMLMMGLRLSEGISKKRFLAETGFEIEEYIKPRFKTLLDENFLANDNDHFGATQKGRLCLDQILREILPDAA